MQFHEKKFFLTIFDFTSFFAWTFLNFLARRRCEFKDYYQVNFSPSGYHWTLAWHQATELSMKKARSSTKDLGVKAKEKAKVLNIIEVNLAYSTTKVVMYSGSKSRGRVRGLLFGVGSGSGINISGTSPSGFRGFGDF